MSSARAQSRACIHPNVACPRGSTLHFQHLPAAAGCDGTRARHHDRAGATITTRHKFCKQNVG
eukprot:10686322-Lingulodinium_polyedra.AAC.1